MNRLGLYILVCLLFSFSAKTQVVDTSKWQYQAEVGAGVSRFHVGNYPKGVDYLTPEVNASFLFKRSIGKSRMSIVFGLGYSEKFTRESYFDNTNPPAIDTTVIPPLDRSVSTGNKRSLNLPILVEYNFYKHNTVGLGIQGRYWMSVDDFTVNSSTAEFGILLNYTRRIANKLSIGVSGYAGLTETFGATVSDTGTGGNIDKYSVFNQYLTLNLRYSF
jgi:hypothetical protein